MSKYPLLISCPRSGSTWVQTYVRQSYLNNFSKTLSFSISHPGDDEFLDDDNFNSDINFKIHFLKLLRERKYELCHKVHTRFLHNEDILNWFIDFYKDHDIIILKRRNLWKALISYLFHSNITKKLKSLYDFKRSTMPELRPRTNATEFLQNDDLLKSTIQSHDIKFTFDKDLCNDYFKQIRYLNTKFEYKIKHLKPQFIYKEDIDTKFLQERFDVKTFVSPTIPLTIKYEIYFKPEDLKNLKEYFEKHYENEFKFYGYEYKY